VIASFGVSLKVLYHCKSQTGSGGSNLEGIFSSEETPKKTTAPANGRRRRCGAVGCSDSKRSAMCGPRFGAAGSAPATGSDALRGRVWRASR